MPRSSQVPPFTQGLWEQGEGAARRRGSLKASGLHGAVLPPVADPSPTPRWGRPCSLGLSSPWRRCCPQLLWQRCP